MHHQFLVRFENERVERDQLKRFLGQWYKMAKAHREAFPGLIANVKDDDLRFELIDILSEEYGNGDRSRIHARLLERLLHAMRLTVPEVEAVTALIAVERFHETISDIWNHGDHAQAIGLHFGLEYLASAFQPHFARGFAKYSYLSEHEREYFDLHAEAEIRHVAYSENGFLRYAEDPSDREKLLDGMRTAEHLLGAVWDDFDVLIFQGC